MTTLIPFAETLLSDMHKDAYGYRPRGLYPEFMTLDEVNAAYQELGAVIESEMLLQQQCELRAQRELEARLSHYMQSFGIDRATALRWEWEGDGAERDLGYWAYQLGVAYALVPMYAEQLRAAGITDTYSS